jgi:hypothetical protein
MKHIVLWIVALWIGGSLACAQEAASPEPLRFNRDIRPILSDNCFTCHGPDASHRQAGLRLDVRDDALKPAESGDIAIVPGKPSESTLVVRIESTDTADVMPPPKSHKRLSALQKERLKRWIAEGAKYESHWAFAPIEHVALPTVKRADWVRTPIDRFVLARLEQAQLAPSPEADRATILRRVALDLTGLPPTLADVEQFLNDKAADAYERAVDRLLLSPHYGERMAVDWLDAARFADTNGYQVDRDRETSAWRDWVIRAFNDNLPFDQFTIEQLAGDLLPNATVQQRIATGFHRNHMMNEEGGIIPEEFLAEYTADRVETTAAVWLGQTFNCARCHDHKFDPFTQRDFYGLKAFFHNVSERGVGSYGSPIRVNNPPFVRLPTPDQDQKLAGLNEQLTSAKQQLSTSPAETAEQLNEWSKRLLATPVLWQPTTLTKADAGKAKSSVESDRTAARVEFPDAAAYTITLQIEANLERVSAVRIECAEAGMTGAARWQDVRVNRVGDKPAAKQSLKLRPVESGDSLALAEVAKTLDDNRTTFVNVSPKVDKPAWGAFELVEPITIAKDKPVRLEVVISAAYGTGPLLWRVAVTDAATDLLVPEAIRTIVQTEPAKRNTVDAKRLSDFRTNSNPARRALNDQIAELTRQIDVVERDVKTTLVMDELPKPRDTFILMRGAYDKPGERVTANTPAVLPAMPSDLPRNRLGLARWLVSRENPLTARVTVNRLWQSVFGTGLVRTSEDFGSQGEAPSHPELLDWLTNEFVQSGWDVKGMMKLIVTSATYRQKSESRKLIADGQLSSDPDNRLFSRGPRFRLQAEFVRDQALAVSGLLVPTIGGPSVRPYHPAGLYEQVVAGSGASTYVPGKGDDLHRRSLYTYWKRSVPNPAMLAFDAPFRETCTLRRARTNTPLQALNLMNDPTFVEAARFLGQRMLRDGGDSVETRLAHGFKLTLARSPRPTELTVLKRAFERTRQEFASDPASAKQLLAVGEARHDANLDPIELATWTTIGSTLLCMDEVITKN